MSSPASLPPATSPTTPDLPGIQTSISNPLDMGKYQDIWDNTIPNRSGTIVVVALLFVLLTSVLFYFRLVWRLAHRQRGLDDIMCLLAYLTLVVETIVVCVAAYYGFGRHRPYIEATLLQATFCFYLYQIFYKILVMYLRIFGTPENKKFKIFTWCMVGAVSMGSLVFAAVSIWQCTPVKRAWDKSVSGHCVDNMAFWYSHAGWNTACDCVIYIMPIPMIRTLNMPKRQMWGLVSVFLLGAFAIAASIVRMAVLEGSASATDQTWGSSVALYWTQIEACTSVICCCLPALRVPFLDCWRRICGRSTDTTSGAQTHAQPGTGQESRRRSTPWRVDSPQDNTGTPLNTVNPAERLRYFGNLTVLEGGDDSISPAEAKDHAGPGPSHQARPPSDWYDTIMSRIDTRTPSASAPSSQRSRASTRARNSITSYHEEIMDNGESSSWSGSWPAITKTSEWRVSSHERNSRPLRREDQEPTLEELLAAGPPGMATEDEDKQKDGERGKSKSFMDLLKVGTQKRKSGESEHDNA
ncbi:hypothetical protein Tdes44962_MAKER00379 [Teratosphaeria destructans]|uniref:Rhodopsin domain-containing protein n=1 Tax=Teratosphaeria destructans TaxID=418781 RepID=A0A9W7SSQ8_9PEZI|nr:hypothetical protein Tdes44962_MAKER00379 [Teratosphaeria destructans]